MNHDRQLLRRAACRRGTGHPVCSVAAALSASHTTGFRLEAMKRRAAFGPARARKLGGQRVPS